MSNASADAAQRRDAVNAALDLAIQRKNFEMIKLAMDNGGKPSVLLDAGIAQENMDMITLALDKGANPNVLLYAGIARGRPMGERLRDFFRQMNETNAEDSKTSLHWVETAIARGADVNGTKNDDKGKPWPAIHWAHIAFRTEIMDRLIRAGAKVDAQSPEGTVLMRAVAGSEKKKIEYYVRHGADPTCVCGDSFPMKALEGNQVFLQRTKARLLSLMMAHLPKPAPEPPPPPAPPADPVGTAHDIEVSKPIELQVPHKFEPPAGKTFSL